MTAITLCTTEHAAKLLPLVERCHEESGIESTEESREAAVLPLLEGSPLGAAWVLGLVRAPVGYIVVTFSWSLELGGMVGAIDELWVRPSVRRRGIATEALHGISGALSDGGVQALNLQVPEGAETALRLFRRAGFQPREGNLAMSRRL
ncbi:GNAT family N-acetyltransferase [Histidinibacterium aquaticum]|uniref:GNAT family N-acetyltransferase n=1 Tax=Histidinibacterium aquaticum TaxID=2613962 RepID=A0A5J5GBQ9_9RHOB|nr:GNAT family N-acetyltransferase [Histidinibacterium aquaticum]KAA9005589.1 GNAT family N-acetyltransferase [Histidinibacterium aquaticum]